MLSRDFILNLGENVLLAEEFSQNLVAVEHGLVLLTRQGGKVGNSHSVGAEHLGEVVQDVPYSGHSHQLVGLEGAVLIAGDESDGLSPRDGRGVLVLRGHVGEEHGVGRGSGLALMTPQVVNELRAGHRARGQRHGLVVDGGQIVHGVQIALVQQIIPAALLLVGAALSLLGVLNGLVGGILGLVGGLFGLLDLIGSLLSLSDELLQVLLQRLKGLVAVPAVVVQVDSKLLDGLQGGIDSLLSFRLGDEREVVGLLGLLGLLKLFGGVRYLLQRLLGGVLGVLGSLDGLLSLLNLFVLQLLVSLGILDDVLRILDGVLRILQRGLGVGLGIGGGFGLLSGLVGGVLGLLSGLLGSLGVLSGLLGGTLGIGQLPVGDVLVVEPSSRYPAGL